MADKGSIVIKKITVVAGGGHGGAWKVAFADFMTAMMTFFLVMWLLASSSEQTKQNVSDYFSTPSVIEYNYSNYGVELTLEKLFLDLINEPLKTLQAFMNPADRTPNIMGLGMKKVVASHIADQLGDVASDVEVSSDLVVFEIPDSYLFTRGSAEPSPQFVELMEKVTGLTMGLEDTDVTIISTVFNDAFGGDGRAARGLAAERLELITKKVKVSLEHDSVDLYGSATNRPANRRRGEGGTNTGNIRFELRQKTVTSEGKRPRPLSDGAFGKSDSDLNVYDNFVKQITDRPEEKRRRRE